MKLTFQRARRAFTLVELSIGIMLGMAISAMVLTLFNQQLAFLKIYQAQNFLTEEAPLISVYVSRLVGKADRFRVHDNLEDAIAGNPASDTSCSAVVLNFRQPDGTMQASILSFDRERGVLDYYVVPPAPGVLGAPQWTVSNKPADVQFSLEQGVLRMRLTGPADEVITYSGTMQQ